MREIMRMVFKASAVCVLLVLMVGCTAKKVAENAFYVSPAGNDTWSGRLAEPNKKGTDGPFATLEQAKNAVRELKKTTAVTKKGITVYIRIGVYRINETLTLTAEDSGTETAPVIWRGYPGEDVRFMGGQLLSGFEPVSDRTVLERIDPAHHTKILQINLKAQGITNFGEIPPGNTRRELFFNHTFMPIARYPDNDWMTIKDVPLVGEIVHKGDSFHMREGHPIGMHCGKFTYDGDRPKRWNMVDDIWMHGYWVWDWSDGFQKVDSIDVKNNTIYPAKPHHGYGYHKGQRFYFLNILEELDSPGEWYIDDGTGVLYFWPPAPIEGAQVTYPILEKPMLSLEEASYITVRNIVFECSRARAITIAGGNKATIAGCTFRNLGETCVFVQSGTNHVITGCDIYDTGMGGIDLNGGDRKTLTPAGNYATNNYIHHYHKTERKGCAINVSGVGNTASHNRIHDGPYAGIYFWGNDHLLEYNDISRIGVETGDVGAIYTCGDWTFRGTTIRYNYFHHIKVLGHVGSMSVYLDLPGSGTLVYGNIFYKVGRGFYTNSGRDNRIENNIFIECEPAIGIQTWREPGIYEPGGAWRMWEKLQEMNITEPPYSTRYPRLIEIFDRDGKGDPGLPEGNEIVRNISYRNNGFLRLSENVLFDIVAVKDNLIADDIIFKIYSKEGTEFTTNDRELVEKFKEQGNIISDGDPRFVDIEHENFTLKEDSPALKLGFKPIPFDTIGLYVDEYRPTLPEKIQ